MEVRVYRVQARESATVSADAVGVDASIADWIPDEMPAGT